MEIKAMTWTGGCLCGAVRYEAEVSASENWYCHCHMCQKATGSVVSTSAVVPKSRLRIIKGDPRFYQSSQFVERGFCSNCGSLLFFRPTNEDWISILSGTLDNPELAPPEGHYGVESRISWLKIEDDLKKERTQVGG
jgi:hypothetical protein